MKLQVMIIVRIAKRALATVPYGGCIELLLFMSTCASCRKNSKVSSFYGTVKIVTANKIIVKKRVRDHCWLPSNTAIKECISNL